MVAGVWYARKGDAAHAVLKNNQSSAVDAVKIAYLCRSM